MKLFLTIFASIFVTASAFAAQPWNGNWDLVARACQSGKAANPDVTGATQALGVTFTDSKFVINAMVAGCKVSMTAPYTANGNKVTVAEGSATNHCTSEQHSVPGATARNYVQGDMLTITFISGAYEPACAANDPTIYTFKRH